MLKHRELVGAPGLSLAVGSLAQAVCSAFTHPSLLLLLLLARSWPLRPTAPLPEGPASGTRCLFRFGSVRVHDPLSLVWRCWYHLWRLLESLQAYSWGAEADRPLAREFGGGEGLLTSKAHRRSLPFSALVFGCEPGKPAGRAHSGLSQSHFQKLCLPHPE